MGRDAGQGAAAGFGIALGEEAVEGVLRDPVDVLHQELGLLEDVVVDALHDVAEALATLVEPGTVGVVDVAGTVGIGVHEVGAHVEERGDGTEIVGGGRSGHMRENSKF